MPQPASESVSQREARGRKFIWIAWIVMLLVAAMFYANKAAEERSAFVRWRHQIHQLWNGTNIWDRYVFPNPPIMPICLSPLMAMPPVMGAVTWYLLKAVMATGAIWMCLRMTEGPGGRRFPWWASALVVLLSLRSLLSDLQHGNINILILFLVVASLYAWRRGLDVAAGLALALAISLKLTPALFVIYFLFKGSWRVVGATLLGLGLFLLVVPSMVLGVSFNGECLAMWWHRMLSPYFVSDFISPQEFNQSMGGVMTRLMAELPPKSARGYGGVEYPVNFLSWSPDQVTLLVKGLSVGLVGALAWLCRTRTTRRDDARLFGEFALVVLTMLFASERTWKHHYVTLLLPYAYVIYRVVVGPASKNVRWTLAGMIALSATLIASTSEAFGGLFGGRHGHEIAMAYGMYFWGGFVLYLAVAWRVWAERGPKVPTAPPSLEAQPPHFGRIETPASSLTR